MYFVSIAMLVMQLSSMKFIFKDDLFPLPQQIRGTYIARCVIGMVSNVSFLISLKFISFSKSSVIFWTSPVFTALGARYFLHERLTIYDWGAVFVAFLGILMI